MHIIFTQHYIVNINKDDLNGFERIQILSVVADSFRNYFNQLKSILFIVVVVSFILFEPEHCTCNKFKEIKPKSSVITIDSYTM